MFRGLLLTLSACLPLEAFQNTKRQIQLSSQGSAYNVGTSEQYQDAALPLQAFDMLGAHGIWGNMH